MMKTLRLLLCVPFACVMFACHAPDGTPRIMGDNEQDLVDREGAGAAVFDRLIDDTVAKLLEPYKGEFAELKVRTLAFIDLENRTKEELADWRDLLIDKIEISINKRRAFKSISVKFVSAVLKEMGNPPVDQLFLPAKRREFAKVLESKNTPVQYLLYGRLTRGSTQGVGQRQANYLLTLELINIATGEQNTVGTEVRKQFGSR